MKRFLSYFLLGWFGLGFVACGYHLKVGKNMEGKRGIYRAYNNTERGEKLEMRAWFKHSRGMGYGRYTGEISSDTAHGKRFVLYDSVRVYLNFDIDDFVPLFTSGVIWGQMFYCAMDKECTPFREQGWIVTDIHGDTLQPDYHGYRGHALIVNRFKRLPNAEFKPTHRRFELCVNNPVDYLSNGCSIYLLELTNEQADENTDTKTFLAGSHVTVLRYAWGEI